MHRWTPLLLAALMLALPAPAPAQDAAEQSTAQAPRNAAPKRGPKAPGADIPATCALIHSAALEEGIDPMVLARLLWDLSRFRPDALPRRPRGREALMKMPRMGPGISALTAQDAAAVGLRDPYDPTEAIPAAARSLARKLRFYGNIGLAVAGYRLDHWRVRRFLAGGQDLPGPAADLVQRVTGTPLTLWRDAPPVRLIPDDAATFPERCAALAVPPPPPPPPPPWGVILDTSPDQSSAEAAAQRLTRRLDPVLAGQKVGVYQVLLPGRPEPVMSVQVGFEERAEAMRLCAQLRTAGLSCMVLKNRAP